MSETIDAPAALSTTTTNSHSYRHVIGRRDIATAQEYELDDKHGL